MTTNCKLILRYYNGVLVLNVRKPDSRDLTRYPIYDLTAKRGWRTEYEKDEVTTVAIKQESANDFKGKYH